MEIPDFKRKETPASLPFVEKYRPDKLDDVISQNDIVTTRKFVLRPFSQDLHRAQEAPAYDLPRPAWNRQDFVYPCAGKDSVRFALSQHDSWGWRELIYSYSWTLPMRGASTWSEILSRASAALSKLLSKAEVLISCSKGMKLVILDECDSMTSAAQFALRRSMLV